MQNVYLAALISVYAATASAVELNPIPAMSCSAILEGLEKIRARESLFYPEIENHPLPNENILVMLANREILVPSMTEKDRLILSANMNIHRPAFNLMNALVAYANRLAALPAGQASARMRMSEELRYNAVALAKELPASLVLDSAASKLLNFYALVISQSQFVEDQRFLDRLKWTITYSNFDKLPFNVRSEMQTEAFAERLEDMNRMSEGDLRPLILALRHSRF